MEPRTFNYVLLWNSDHYIPSINIDQIMYQLLHALKQINRSSATCRPFEPDLEAIKCFFERTVPISILNKQKNTVVQKLRGNMSSAGKKIKIRHTLCKKNVLCFVFK